MKRFGLTGLLVVFGLVLVTGVCIWGMFPPRRSHFVPHPRAATPMPKSKQEVQIAVHKYLEYFTRTQSNLRLEILGTVGTPVLVAYEVDQTRTGILEGVVPTNFNVSARRCLYFAVKNTGKTIARLDAGVQGPQGSQFYVPHRSASSGYPGSERLYPPLFGFSAQMEWGAGESYGGLSELTPADWPQTLPAGMTSQDAKEHDFARERHQARLREYQTLLVNNSTNQDLLVECGWECHNAGDRNGATWAFERLLKTDCNDAWVLNNAAYNYAEDGGTNLDLALQAAKKARELLPDSHYVIDTLAWVDFKRGSYEEALALLKELPGRLGPWEQRIEYFHLGFTHYMLMDEDAARASFEAFKRVGGGPEAPEVQKCLEILDIKETAPKPPMVARLRTRLSEMPDDPVALTRLAAMYEGREERDSLILKALGLAAYRRAKYARAIEYLAASAKERPGDAELFFHLGMVCHQLGKKKEAALWLQTAIAAKLKPAKVEEATRIVGSLGGQEPATSN